MAESAPRNRDKMADKIKDDFQNRRYSDCSPWWAGVPGALAARGSVGPAWEGWEAGVGASLPRHITCNA